MLLDEDDDFIKPPSPKRRLVASASQVNTAKTKSRLSLRRKSIPNATQNDTTGINKRAMLSPQPLPAVVFPQPQPEPQPLDHPLPKPSCPVCGVDLTTISHTQIGQEAHVNACLERAPAQLSDDFGGADESVADAAADVALDDYGPHAEAEDDNLQQVDARDPWDGLHEDDHDMPAEEPACYGDEEEPAMEPEDGGHVGTDQPQDISADGEQDYGAVHAWLVALDLAHHLPLFQQAEVDELALPLLSDADLQVMGISSATERAAMLQSIAEMHEQAAQEPGLTDAQLAPIRGAGASPAGSTPAASAARPAGLTAASAVAAAAPSALAVAGAPAAASAQLPHPGAAAGRGASSGSGSSSHQQPNRFVKPLVLNSFAAMFNSNQPRPCRITNFFQPKGNQQQQQHAPPPQHHQHQPHWQQQHGHGHMHQHSNNRSPFAPLQQCGGGSAHHHHQQRQPPAQGPAAGTHTTTLQPQVHGHHPQQHGPHAKPQSFQQGPGSGQNAFNGQALWGQENRAVQQGPRSMANGVHGSNTGVSGAIGGHQGTVLAQPHAPPGKPGGGWSGSALRGVPRWHTIPGTRFTVDYFGPRASKVRGCTHWILSHFHADHYKGLTKSFDQGTVVCSPITAQLVNAKLKVPWSKITVVPLDTPTVVDGVRLTFVDANHCPGAAMIVAEPPGCKPVLHTGDCRLIPDMQQHPALQALRGRSALLVLDTTYCDPNYCFPSQQEVLRFTMEAVRSERFNARALFVFGTYTIGKERLFLEVAHALNAKVYVAKDKMQTLQCCNLAPEYAKLLTTNHLEANIHAVPLFKVSQEGLSSILAHYKGRYTTVVGFQPTGWTQQRQQKKGGVGRRTQRGTIITYQVPYSEHSSFKELHDFVSWLKPSEIIPSVGNDCGPKLQQMLQLLRQPLPATAQATRPITSFMQPAAAPQQQQV